MKPAILQWNELDQDSRRLALGRPRPKGESISDVVADIVRQVRTGGDEAVLRLSEQFDGRRPQGLAIQPSRIAEARAGCEQSLINAMQEAEERIRLFHSADVPQSVRLETAPGMRCEVRYRPIDPVGLYVPGGSAVLVSTVLMLGVPASAAGCTDVVLCTPPGPDGDVAPELLAAAALAGIRRVFAIGGAQAIAAMAYGTESVPRCSKLFGPGNAWVTEAKMQVSQDPQGAAIDLPAGPSEVFVIADDSADATAVAWDLLAQAEHGPDSQVILATDSNPLALAVSEELESLAAGLPRVKVLESSLAAARLIVTTELDQALQIANSYAPEHLIINTREARRLADEARNAGSIFIGPWTPESLGDYCSGTNHVLPTYGWARSHSALSVADFLRRYTIQEANLDALRELGPATEALAAFEGLEAHRMSVRHRLEGADSP